LDVERLIFLLYLLDLRKMYHSTLQGINGVLEIHI
jgi:hypothetical protein